MFFKKSTLLVLFVLSVTAFGLTATRAYTAQKLHQAACFIDSSSTLLCAQVRMIKQPEMKIDPQAVQSRIASIGEGASKFIAEF